MTSQGLLPGWLQEICRRRHEFNLQPLADLAEAETPPGRWIATGPAPQFRLHPLNGRFPRGWVLLETRLIRHGTDYAARLLLDTCHAGERAIEISATRKGVVNELVYFPRGVAGIRLAPMQAQGEMEVGPVTLTEVCMPERVYRMVHRIVHMLQVHPREKLAFLRISVPRMIFDLKGTYAAAGRLRAYATPLPYDQWAGRFQGLSGKDRHYIRRDIAGMDRQPLISLVMVVTDHHENSLRATIQSVRGQLYGRWELCIAATGEKAAQALRQALGNNGDDGRIRVECPDTQLSPIAALNRTLAAARGEYIARIDPGDTLAEHALYWVAAGIREDPCAKVFYSDEDRIGDQGEHHSPVFKPAWSPDLFHSRNYLSRLLVLSADLIRAAGGFREDSDGAEEHDLMLRCLKDNPALAVAHLPALLYHQRADSPAGADSGKRAAAEMKALETYFGADCGTVVEAGPAPMTFRVRHPLPEPLPKVALIIPTRDAYGLLHRCIESILDKTSYPNFEILLVDNRSEEKSALEYLAQLAQRPEVGLMSYPGTFNYSAINNLAVRQTDAEIIGLINNDVEVISPDWLTDMVRHAVRPEIGAVGAKLYYEGNWVQHAGVILGLGGVAGHGHRFFPRSSQGYDRRLATTQNFSAVTGACMVLRRSVYWQVGGLNEADLKIAFNDVDLCLKIRAAGYRVVWTPDAELYHHESASRGQDDTLEKQQRFEAERDYMRRRWQMELAQDPYYSPFLTMEREDFSLAQVPRPCKPWLPAHGRRPPPCGNMAEPRFTRRPR